MNALLELLSCAIWIAEVPWFVIVTFCEAGLPTFTSPKSTARGLRFMAVGFEDENAAEFDPHPDSPSPSINENAVLTAMCLLKLFVFLESSFRIGAPNEVTLRNLYIGITCAKNASTDAQIPADLAAGRK